MKIFISWSGSKSKELAETLKNWIRKVIQAAEPWISIDIEKGSRWGPKISNKLEESKVGIICLTQDNLASEWIHFEAGALSKTKDAYVCTFLLDIKPSDVKLPLAQFQHTLSTQEDIRKLLHDINLLVEKNGEKKLDDTVLDEIFEIFWPELEKKLNDILTREQPVIPQRTERELIEEILEIVRLLHLKKINGLFLSDRNFNYADLKQRAGRTNRKINNSNNDKNQEKSE
jgi:hypothetical protein